MVDTYCHMLTHSKATELFKTFIIPSAQAAKDYLEAYVNPTLLKGLTSLCKKKPSDPVTWLADWLLENNPNKPKTAGPRVDMPTGSKI